MNSTDTFTSAYLQTKLGISKSRISHFVNGRTRPKPVKESSEENSNESWHEPPILSEGTDYIWLKGKQLFFQSAIDKIREKLKKTDEEIS